MAKRDAKEFARAKMSYGEGAGNRRKIIKAQVEQRSKDAGYKAAYEHHLSNQDMASHAKAAKNERTAKDTYKASKRAARVI